MKRFLVPLILPGLLATGCLTARDPQSVAYWTVESGSSAEAAPAASSAEASPRAQVRLAQTRVRAPYDGVNLVVRRGDGSLAFDPLNRFAAAPASLLAGAAEDVLARSGAFKTVVSPASSVRAELSAELAVTRFELDCTEEGARKAAVQLTLTLVRDRAVYARLEGAAEVDAADGNYTRAFSQAFVGALKLALGKL